MRKREQAMPMTVQQLIDKLTDIPYHKRVTYSVMIGIASESVIEGAETVEIDDTESQILIIDEW